MLFFPIKTRCPYCNKELSVKPIKTQECPHCGENIFVRSGGLVTEEEAKIMDWLVRLEFVGGNRQDFDKQRNELSKQFGTPASVNDTI